MFLCLYSVKGKQPVFVVLSTVCDQIAHNTNKMSLSKSCFLYLMSATQSQRVFPLFFFSHVAAGLCSTLFNLSGKQITFIFLFSAHLSRQRKLQSSVSSVDSH